MTQPNHSACLIVANPVSGGGRGRHIAMRAQRRLAQAGVEVELRFTARRGEAGEMARAAVEQEMPRIVVCGGDGTIHEVVNAIAETRMELGLLPCGRGNDLARALHIPTRPDAAVNILLNGACQNIDLGKVGARYFGTVVTLGFDSEVARLVYEKAVPLSGTGAYILAVLQMLRTYTGIPLRMSGDFGVVEMPVFLAATGNTSTYGGGMKILPSAVPNDGLLDICHVRMMNKFDVLRMFPTIFRGGHIALPEVNLYRTARVTMETPKPVVLFADGEPAGHTPADIRVVPGALCVVCP
ncbi:MAG: diacylglycerol kinase family lipid kinase [candidate division Zixibacteria bacterium]|nr:diacylglycerol kinase family lipid kinase [candidate division Zixibacteria bacterium]